MKKTLQDQYLLIKEGKGHKGVFLTEAKRQFPNIVRNAATFDEAAASLITKNIIAENVMGLGAINSPFEVKKKQSFETAFEAFLAEAKKKENEEEKVKAEEKKVSKPVEEDYSRNFDRKDDKNIDNLIFDQVMNGYYAEMKDPKNADKTMQQLKDIVMKNLQKDPIYYTKDGQFGVKGLGYTTEAPGLGTPKEAKGKYKSSGYGDLKESQMYYTDEDETELDLKSKVINMGVSPLVVDSIFNTKGLEGLKDRLKEKDVRDMSWTKGFTKEEQTLREVVRKMIAEELEENYESLDYYTSVISSNNMSEEDAYAYLGDQGLSSLEIDSIIDQAFPDDIEEMRHLGSMFQSKLGDDKEKGEPSDPNPNPTAKIPAIIVDKLKRKGLTVEDGVVKMPKLLQMQIENKQIDFIKDLSLNKKTYPYYKALADSANYISTKDSNMFRFKKAVENEDGSITISLPSLQKESLLEGVEKDLADINKEAEHEVLQSKMEKIQSLIDKKQSQISRLDEDEDMKDLTDDKKVKEISKDIKALEKAKAKLEKIMSRFKGKKPESKKVIDEMDNAEAIVDDIDDEYIEDADKRLRNGEEIDSILSNYPNLPFDAKNHLRNYLDWKQNSDIGQSDELDTDEEF